MAVQINVAANQAALTASIQAGVQAYNQRFAQNNQLNLTVNQRAFSQPLGRMTGDVKDFEAALAASNARVIAFGASTAVLGGVIRSFKELASVTIDVEKNLADINRVFGLSTSQLQKFSTELFNVGKQTASTFDDASKAALEFSRQGLKAEDVLTRTKDALTLTRLAGIGTANAVDALTSTVNGFAATGVTTTQILNKLVAVEQDYAVGAGDLAEALSRTGQAAQEAGVSLDQLNALVTAAQQSTARGGAVIGNALKTIFTRLQRTETLDQLEAFDIAVRDVQGNILPAVTILQNFAGAYKKLGDAQRAQLSEQVAGVYQVNILKAIVGDLNKSQGVYAGALQRGAAATNEAEIATAKLNQTLDALLKQTATSTQQLANNIGKVTFEPLAKYGTEQLKSFVESMNEILEGEGVGSTFANGLLKGIRNVIAGPGAIAAFFTLFKLIQNSFTYLAQALPQIAGITTETQNRKNIEQSILQIMQQQGPASQALAGLMGNQAAQAQLLLQIARQQTAEYQTQSTLAKQLAAQLATQGVRVKGSGGLQVTRAGGYIPAATRMAEVVGAQAGGYAPGRVVSSPVGGVMNTAEDVKYIPGFAQPFINPPAGSKAGRAHRQNAISRTGVDPYMNSGFIPNFAITGLAAKDFDKEGQGEYKILAGRIFESLLRGESYLSLTENKVKADVDIGKYAIREAKLSGKAAYNDPNFGDGKLKGRYLILPKTASTDYDQRLEQNKNADIFRAPYTHANLFARSKKIIEREKKNKTTDPSNIPLFDGFIPNFATPMTTASIPWFKKYSSKYKNAAGDADLFKMGDFPTYGRGSDHEYAKKGNANMLSYLHEDFVRSALNIALGSKQVIRPSEVGFRDKPISDIANENDFDLLYRIADGSYSMLELKQDFRNISGSVTGFMNKKLANLEKENPVLAKKVSSMIAVSNRPKFTDPTGRNAGANFSEFEMAAASIVKDKYSNVDPLISAKLTKVTDGLLRRYEAKKNTTYDGFIPNFAYKQAVMGLEESMSGNKAIFDTKPFPHIRNSSQPTFSSAIADHGGLGNALSDSMRGQKAAGLMNKGFVPNFAPRPYRYSGRGSTVDPSSSISQYSTSLGLSLADQERQAREEFNRIINALRAGAMNAQQATTAFNTLNTQAGLSARAQTSLTRILTREVAAAGAAGGPNASRGSRFSRFSKGLSRASTAISLAGPAIAGFAEQFAFGDRQRTEMTSNERIGKSLVSTGLSAVTTGAGIGASFGAPGAIIGGVIGGLVGLTSALNGAKLSTEELSQLAEKQVTEQKQIIDSGEKYVDAQNTYRNLLLQGVTGKELEKASKNVKSAFEEIKDVKLAQALAETKDGVEGLNSILDPYRQKQKKLEQAQAFLAADPKQTESLLYSSLANSNQKDIFKKLSSGFFYKTPEQYFQRPTAGGVNQLGVGNLIGKNALEEGYDYGQLQTRELNQILDSIVNSLGEGLNDEMKQGLRSKIRSSLLDPKQREDLIKNLTSFYENTNKNLGKQAEDEKEIGYLLKTREIVQLEIIKKISEANSVLKQSEFSQKLLSSINDFEISLMEGLVSPLEVASKKASSQKNKMEQEANREQRKSVINFVKENYAPLIKSSKNPEMIKDQLGPAIKKMLEGDFTDFENIVNPPSVLSPEFLPNAVLDADVVLKLREAYELFKESQKDQKDNFKNELDLFNNDTYLQNLKNKTILLQSGLIKDEISLIAQRERAEIQRKNTLDLEIDAIERRQSDEANYFGMSVAGKAQGKANFRNQSLQKKLLDSQISRSKSAQSDYNQVVKMQNTNLLTQADILESQGRSEEATTLRQKAQSYTGVEINNLDSLKEAISGIQAAGSFADPKQEEQRINTLKKLETIQTEIIENKTKEIELNDRLNKQELIMAERSTSFKYGVVKGFDNLRTESELMIGRLGEDLPKMFADGLVNGIKAAIRESDNLGSALMGIASSFLDTISTTLMQSAVYGILGNIGVPNLPVGGKQRGGVIRAQSGMYISGVGSGDKYPALLENGEYVLNRNAVMAMGGPASLDKLNFSAAPRFAAGGTFSSSFDDISSMESNMTSYGLEESKLYNELRDQKRAEIEAARQKKRAQRQQMAGLIGSLAGAAVSLGISAGVNKFSQPGGYASTTAGKLESKTSLLGNQEAMTIVNGRAVMPSTYQVGGSIGSRLSDTIPAYATGGLINSPIVKRYAIGGVSSAGFGTAAGNNSTVNNNTSASNSFNFNTTVQRDGKIQVGANSTSYAQQDVELSQSLNGKVYDVVLETIRKEKRFGGSLAGIRN